MDGEESDDSGLALGIDSEEEEGQDPNTDPTTLDDNVNPDQLEVLQDEANNADKNTEKVDRASLQAAKEDAKKKLKAKRKGVRVQDDTDTEKIDS